MKKIFLSLLAVAALASCTKSEVLYDAPQEIGFKAVAGNITKAVVDGTTYPTTLNMYVYAQTTDNTAAEANYISNGEFAHKTDQVNGTDVWGGWDSNNNAASPYYWPNVKKLHFAGYSKSGNVTSATVTYDCTDEKLTITGYTPGTETGEGANDLMWFPTTELTKAEGYGKETAYVPVNMYHTCAWITFLVKGDNVTGGSSNPYKITAMTMSEIDQTADVACSATSSTTDNVTTVTPTISWSNNNDKTDNTTPANVQYKVTLKNSSISLTETAKNVETDAAYPSSGNTEGNIVVIPQVPGKLSLTYQYTSAANQTITETVSGLDLALAKDASDASGPSSWEPGKHYIYTITIKANEILIAPTPVVWTDSNHNITIE